MTTSRPRPGTHAVSVFAALLAMGCVGPVLSPVHPMTALPTPSGFGATGTLGVGQVTDTQVTEHDAKVNEYFDGDLHFSPISYVDFSFGLGWSSPSPSAPFVPCCGIAGTAAVKLVLLNTPVVAVAVAPRAAISYVLNDATHAPADHASALQAPVLLSFPLEGASVLTFQGWYRRFPSITSASEPVQFVCLDGCDGVSIARDSGHAWGGAVQVDFASVPTFSLALFVSVEDVFLDSGIPPHLAVVGGVGITAWGGGSVPELSPAEAPKVAPVVPRPPAPDAPPPQVMPPPGSPPPPAS